MNIQELKDKAFAQYQRQGRYEVIYTNYITDMFKQYDALVAKGYTRADDAHITATNINFAVQQVIHMVKPEKLQAQELQSIYDNIEGESK
ncbi:hypothetical protein [Pseudomonas sp. LB3P38]|uniref:hypothetical protein n=1 Tax=Pseudomonas lyxosi TaxID=3398358 RepID=UPI0039F0EA56